MGLIYQSPRTNDENKRWVLIIQAQSCGWMLAEAATEYLLRHYGCDMTYLISALQKLDDAFLVENRSLVIPFFNQVLSYA